MRNSPRFCLGQQLRSLRRGVLAPIGFCGAGKNRILINMDKIERMEKEEFVLTNGAQMPISQRRRSAVRAGYMQYLLNK